MLQQGSASFTGTELVAEIVQMAKPRYHFAAGQVCVCARVGVCVVSVCVCVCMRTRIWQHICMLFRCYQNVLTSDLQIIVRRHKTPFLRASHTQTKTWEQGHVQHVSFH